MTIDTETARNSLAAGLGRRHSHLLHSVLFGCNIIREGVYRQPYRYNDERSTAFEAVVESVRDQADQLDSIANLLQEFETNTQVRDFLGAAHADNMDCLQWSWNSAYDDLRTQADDLPGKAARELDRTPRDIFGAEPAEVGARYADLTYWAVGSLRELHLSARHPTRHKNSDETSLTKEIRHSKALLLALENTGRLLESVEGPRAGAVLAQYDAQTRLRTRMVADEVARRLGPQR